MVPLCWTVLPPELKIEKKIQMISPRSVVKFQNNFIEMFLLCYLSICRNGSTPLKKNIARAKNRKKQKQKKQKNKQTKKKNEGHDDPVLLI